MVRIVAVSQQRLRNLDGAGARSEQSGSEASSDR